MTASLFGTIEPYAGDPILSLNDAFGVDPRPNKVNLSIGIYTDDEGRLPVLDSVLAAQTKLGFGARPYLPMDGLGTYRNAVQRLVFGDDHEAVASGRIATIQTIGGTGAVGIAADFLAVHAPGRVVAVSDPTWENHHGLFQRAGFATQTFPWWDSARGVASTDTAVDAISALPSGSIVILQPVCHNPTGTDLTRDQQDFVTRLCREKGHIVVFDMAYQGFGDGVDADASWVRRCASDGLTFFVANSFSKNFSLYGERCGGLSVVTPSADEGALVLGQLKLAIRRSYSNGPTTGPQIVAEVLTDPQLRQIWEDEVTSMRNRMIAMRTHLAGAIQAQEPSVSTAFLVEQRGMFSYTGLSAEAVVKMRNEDAVYLIETGRVCVAGLTRGNVDAVAASMAKALAAVSRR
jgi:aromatic-amino-acid transaminase